MAIKITENYTGRTHVPGSSGTRVFEAECTTSDTSDDILAALKTAYAVDYGSYHPWDPIISVQSDGISIGDGFTLREITVNYKFGSGGTQRKDQQPPTFRIITGNTTEQVDRSFDGWPLVNSVGDVPSPHPTRRFSEFSIEIERFESIYSFNNAFSYQDSVNSDIINLGPFGSIDPGILLMESVTAPDKFRLTDSLIRIVYLIRGRRGIKKDADGLWDSWKIRFLDQGKRAYYADGGTNKRGNIYVKDGSQWRQVSQDVKLNGMGSILSTSSEFKVSDQHVSSVSLLEGPKGAIIDYAQDQTYGAWIKYLNYGAKAFNALNLF